jgi:hypothetical protein
MNDIVTLEHEEKIMTRDEMMAYLESIGIEVIGTSEQFDGGKNGIWISGESDDHRINYWTENYNDYTFGIENELNEEVEKRGWWFEWHDAGTLMCFPMR